MHIRHTKISAAPALSSIVNSWWEMALGTGGVRPARNARPKHAAEEDASAQALRGGPAAAHLVAGAFAHLARHVESGCPQAARLAALLLTRVADDPAVDPHLREQARELAETLERGTDGAERAGREERPAANGHASAHGWKHGFILI